MFEISVSAEERIAFLLKKENKRFFRISVIGGGCSGFKYDLDFVDDQNQSDHVISAKEIKVLIDEVSLPFLQGSMLDYEETLGSAEFKIKNPQATAKCGCGSSFSI